MSVKQFQRLIPQILFIVISLSLLTGCEKRKTIVNGLDEREANEIVVFLSNEGVDAAKVKSAEGSGGGGSKIALWDISVPEEQAIEAMSMLNRAGLPKRSGQSLLGIFSNTGLVPSEMQERIRYQAGLAEQIASTIRKFDGVLDAEVQISFPEEDPLNPGQKKGEITASVYVKHSGVLDDPNTHAITKIKRLVTGAVTGLKYDNVTVIADRARFADFPIGLQRARDEDKEYVSVWTIIVAKESLNRFRLVFFSFTLLLLFLILAFVWISWKISPLIKENGGFSSLFSLSPMTSKKKKKEKKRENEEGAEEGSEEEPIEKESEEEKEEEGEEPEEDTSPTDVT
ncbi:type III secretion periplasmic lipoprotein [Waddlia chondrophila 2032/99]|uniref:Type III secretion lipoprotein SctJ n=2 Tax=Waddlia chondrophila TaxID=71667 RepID=D6YTL0_WADCW|nr:type III secretion inner membrane ring lipoprotein SctJ [Waddlia chondrophila]ADI37471.1 type III secretion lipoprotein SctJ [Waddlia chondrophila WSU 86-1044]CCB90787.1 type III secretion periplasmic lipoprotein [Waddlia chondrophila 2032/99]